MLVIAHRGACGYRPEHTLASYALAARMGADYIEPDLVITPDGVLVARHEPEISATTDVAARSEFAGAAGREGVDGHAYHGWFTEDFTLAELRRCGRWSGSRDCGRRTRYDGLFESRRSRSPRPARALSEELGRRSGVYPETKHPTYFRGHRACAGGAARRGAARTGCAGAPVILQSFEVGNLERLAGELEVPIVQILGGKGARPYDFVVSGDRRTYADLAQPSQLRGIAAYAVGIGPSKDHIVPRDAAGNSLPPTSFVGDAHDAGLLVHPYTFRAENAFLPLELRSSDRPAGYGDLAAELRQFLALGVDGLFTDNPDRAVAARGEADGGTIR